MAFRLSDSSSAAPELLGVWREDSQALAFHNTGLSVWRADLPADPDLARDQMAARALALRWSRGRLPPTVAAAELAALADPIEFAAPESWRAACDDFTGLATRVARACSPTAMFETRVGDDLIGRSYVTMRGDTRTAWSTGAGRGSPALHLATVALGLSTRQTLLRIVALVAGAAPAIAARLVLPLGPLLAMPLAWRAIQRLLAQSNLLGSLHLFK